MAKAELNATLLAMSSRLSVLLPSLPVIAVLLACAQEHEALLGAQRLLRRPPGSAPIIIFEMYERLRPDLVGLPTLHYLRSLGYVCYEIMSGKGLALSDGSLTHAHRCCTAQHARGSTCTRWQDIDGPPGAGAECAAPLASDFVCVKPTWASAAEEEQRAMQPEAIRTPHAHAQAHHAVMVDTAT